MYLIFDSMFKTKCTHKSICLCFIFFFFTFIKIDFSYSLPEFIIYSTINSKKSTSFHYGTINIMLTELLTTSVINVN